MAQKQRRLSRKQQQWRPGQRKKPSSVMVMFGATTLLMEAFVVFFGGLAAFGIWGAGHTGRVPVLIGAAVNAAFDTVFPQKSTTRARLELVQRLRERMSVRDS